MGILPCKRPITNFLNLNIVGLVSRTPQSREKLSQEIGWLAHLDNLIPL